MIVHEFVNGNKPCMILIHGVLTPWQIWTPQIDAFIDKYNIYVIALNAHTEEVESEFVSLTEESEEIIQYFEKNNIYTVDVLCGISLGGKIAHCIWKSCRLNINNLILDGAPLVSCPKFAINIMIKNYKDIIHKSKKRDPKVITNFKKHFLPEKYLNNYLKIADLFTDESIENIVNSAFGGGEIKGGDAESRILYMHGTKANEMLSKKSARLIKKYYPTACVVCFKGDAHCYKVIYEPEKWIAVVKSFLNKSDL